jgi:hypothetical protein
VSATLVLLGDAIKAEDSTKVQHRLERAEQKPGAHWSDDYKQRMQADMDQVAHEPIVQCRAGQTHLLREPINAPGPCRTATIPEQPSY